MNLFLFVIDIFFILKCIKIIWQLKGWPQEGSKGQNSVYRWTKKWVF